MLICIAQHWRASMHAVWRYQFSTRLRVNTDFVSDQEIKLGTDLWYPGQPDHIGGNQYYVVLWMNGQGPYGLDDLRQSIQRRFICMSNGQVSGKTSLYVDTFLQWLTLYYPTCPKLPWVNGSWIFCQTCLGLTQDSRTTDFWLHEESWYSLEPGRWA